MQRLQGHQYRAAPTAAAVAAAAVAPCWAAETPGTACIRERAVWQHGGAPVQGSHGFTQSSRWAPRVGAFINLESTGSGGPDVLFQHTAHWTVQTYAAAAVHPRGSVIGQVPPGRFCKMRSRLEHKCRIRSAIQNVHMAR